MQELFPNMSPNHRGSEEYEEILIEPEKLLEKILKAQLWQTAIDLVVQSLKIFIDNFYALSLIHSPESKSLFHKNGEKEE